MFFSILEKCKENTPILGIVLHGGCEIGTKMGQILIKKVNLKY